MGERIRILLVDDAAVAGRLERADERFAVTSETDPRTVSARLDAAPFDCLVSDHDAGGVDGLSLLRTVRAEWPTLPFVLFTSEGSEAVANEAFSAGATDYVRKTADAGQYAILANRIRQAVSEREARERVDRFERLQSMARDVTGDLVRADGRGAVDRAVCERLAAADPYAWAAVGERDDGEVTARAVDAGDGPTESFDVPLDTISAVRTAVEKGTPAIELDDGDAIRDPGRDAAAVIAVPLECESTRHGVLAVGTADRATVSPSERDLLEELGDDVAGALHRLDVRRGLRESEEKYRRLVEQNLVGVYIIQHGEFEYVNPRLAAMFGYTQSELLDEVTPFDLVVEADQEKLRRNLRRRESGDVDDLRYTLRGHRHDGTHIEFEVHGGRIDYGGEPAVMGTLLDVTEQKRYERELEQSRAEYRELFEGIPEAVFFRQDDEPFRAVNESAVSRLGYSREELLSMRPSDIDPNLDHEAESERLDTLERGEIERFDTTHVTKSGEQIPVVVSATRVPYRGETAILSTARDVSERVERERELRRQNERLEELASVVSHDLRNPLNVAAGHLKLARNGSGDTPHLDVASDALDRMGGLIDNLLSLASGAGIEPRVVELEAFVDECWANVATGEARLERDISYAIVADESRLAQVFENLFRNSVEHGSTDNRPEAGDSVEHDSTANQLSPPDAAVVISIGELEDGFYVADDGQGLDVSDPDRVFDSGYSTAENGTGLGLTIVRDVVEAHGWEITVTESECGGVRFEITGVERAD